MSRRAARLAVGGHPGGLSRRSRGLDPHRPRGASAHRAWADRRWSATSRRRACSACSTRSRPAARPATRCRDDGIVQPGVRGAHRAAGALDRHRRDHRLASAGQLGRMAIHRHGLALPAADARAGARDLRSQGRARLRALDRSLVDVRGVLPVPDRPHPTAVPALSGRTPALPSMAVGGERDWWAAPRSPSPDS